MHYRRKSLYFLTPLWGQCRNGGEGAASFGSFRIANIMRLRSTALTVEIGVCTVNKAIILFSKTFRPAFAEALRAGRSKAPPAASLFPGQFSDHGGRVVISCPLLILTQSPGGREE